MSLSGTLCACSSCNLPGDPRRFVRSRVRMVIPDRLTVRQRGQQLFFDAVHVFIDQ